MNKSETLINLLLKKPLSKKEIDTALGFEFSTHSLALLIKNGMLEKFDALNDDEHARSPVVVKFKAIAEYKNLHGKKKPENKATSARYIAYLKKHGYSVTKPTHPSVEGSGK